MKQKQQPKEKKPIQVNTAQNVTTAVAPQNVTDLANAVFAAIKQFTH